RLACPSRPSSPGSEGRQVAAEAEEGAPAAADLLEHRVDRAVRRAPEDLEASVRVRGGVGIGRGLRAADGAAGIPVGSGRSPPDVPQGAVAAAREDLEASIGVAADGGLADDPEGARVEEAGPAPGGKLHDVVQAAVGARGEDLETTVGVGAYARA